MKHHILVAGMDYEFTKVDFEILCQNRMKRIILKNAKQEDLIFQIFDFKKGVISKNEVTYPKGKKLETNTSVKLFDEISTSSYKVPVTPKKGNQFLDGQTLVMSITDIYKAVQDIGAGPNKNSLVELSFFSHGWMGGPILVNSFDDIHTSASPLRMSTIRDPDDKDPRPGLDFISPNMDATALKNFQNAFAPTGFVWIWGCAFPRAIHSLLTKIERNRSYKGSGLSDDALFLFNNLTDEEIIPLKAVLLGLVGPTPFSDKTKIELKFKFIKFAFGAFVTASYLFVMAKNSGVKTFGAVQGTYANYESGVRFPLMLIHPAFTNHLNFYKNYLGFKFDPEGRKYGEYLPTFSFPVPSVP